MIFTLPSAIVRAWNVARVMLANPSRSGALLIPMRHAGQVVDSDTAMTVSGYWRAVNYISGQIAGLPWNVIQESNDRTTVLRNHPVARVLRRASDEVGKFTFLETMIAWALTWGNAYAEIERDQGDRPHAMHLVSPDRAEVKRGSIVNGVFQENAAGKIHYKFSNRGGEATILPSRDVFHLHGLGFDGLVGYSVINIAARSLGITIAVEAYQEDFFANGLVSTGYLAHPGTLKEKAHKNLKKDIEEKSRPGQKFRPLILEEGMEWKDMGLPSDDAQLLETRKLQISDLARWFGLPPHKLADLERATFSNIESQSTEVVNDCFMPWIHRIEEEANFKLLNQRELGVSTKLNVRGLLRGDAASRAAYYQIMTQIGAYSVNQVLRLEDMDPIGPEGDERLVQLNQTTLKRLVEGPPAPKAIEDPDDPAEPYIPTASYQILFQDAFRRIMRREAGRFEQNRHKFTTPEAFAGWLDEFKGQHGEYVSETLRPVVMSLAAQFPAGAMAGTRLQVQLRKIAAMHLEMCTTWLHGLFNEAGDYDIERKSRESAMDALDRLVTAVTMETTR
jgi:HK97 family phage portal protein